MLLARFGSNVRGSRNNTVNHLSFKSALQRQWCQYGLSDMPGMVFSSADNTVSKYPRPTVSFLLGVDQYRLIDCGN